MWLKRQEKDHLRMKESAMSQLTPRDDARKSVSEILKRVDNLIKAEQFDQAVHEVYRAKQIDPNNVYVYAYDERIGTLVEQVKQREIETASRTAEEDRRKAEEVQRKREAEARKKEQEERIRRELETRQKEEEDQKRRELELKREEEERRLKAQAEEVRFQKMRKEENKSEKGMSHPEALSIYRKSLLGIWVYGSPDRSEEIRLLNLRASLSITLEEHAVLQIEVTREVYCSKLRRGWLSGLITSETSPLIAEYQKQFRISPQEHAEIQAQVLSEVRTARQRASIMVIDDDEKMLDFLAETLSSEGFIVHAYSTTDDAYKAIHTNKPDLILSDINLETSTMGGFSFYEKVQEVSELQDIPFLFLSGLTDEALIRAGKELGVDDYITKPFSEQSLIATIRGKLRRFRQLRRLRVAS